MGIDSYSTTPASNIALFPEGMAPSNVNDSARQVQADIRAFAEDGQWLNWGYTHTYVSSTSFKVSGTDVTSTFEVGGRVKVVGSSTGTIYGTITASSFSTDTTVTVSFDSGSMSNESLTVSVGISRPGNNGLPGNLGGGALTSGFIIVADGTNYVAKKPASDGYSGLIQTVVDKDYKIVVKAPHSGTITETTTICTTGTSTFTFKVNTTALGGTANSVSSSEQSQAHASDNTFAAGDDIVITASSTSACQNASFTIKYDKDY